MNFNEWLHKNTNLSDSSIYKYSRALLTVSKEMRAKEVIAKPIEEMEKVELDLAISLILFNPDFLAKDKRGNKMYSNSLKQFRYYIESYCETSDNVEKSIVEQVENNKEILETERKAIISARIGQGQFRQKLIEKYHRCIITKVDNKKLLIASHIKPWAVSDNSNRVSVDNGLLLTPTYDKLFDSGLITFDKNGKIYLSNFIGKENEKRLNLERNSYYNLKLNNNVTQNLEYHRDVVFVK